jgi:hypothetical protein
VVDGAVPLMVNEILKRAIYAAYRRPGSYNFERGLNFEFRMEATDFEKLIYSSSPSI